MLEFLLRTGCSVDAPVNDSNSTLFMVACSEGDIVTAQWLLDNGAKTNLIDGDMETALNYAVYSGYIDIVKMIVERSPTPVFMKPNKEFIKKQGIRNIEYLYPTSPKFEKKFLGVLNR